MTEEIINADGSRNYQANILLDNVKRLEAENKRLQAENEEVNKNLISERQENAELATENWKLRKALEEIREYLQQFKKKKNNFYTLNDVISDIAGNIEKIISEVLK